jgi:hypothetical protein
MLMRSVSPIHGVGWSDSSWPICRRVRTAITKGFVKNLEDRKGRPGRYVVGDPMPDDVVVLPTPEEVLQRCRPLQEGVQHSNPHGNEDF